MPSFINWLFRLIPTNPICMRLVSGGSKRTRHLYLRAGYLAVMTVTLLIQFIGVAGSSGSLRSLAKAGANAFEIVAYLQLGLICLLAPIFMAGAIAQEANPRTWDILLTTPLNSLQVVLGNLMGRLFFILALLVSSLPLFAVTQYFGGIPGRSIFASYGIAAAAATVVGAIAIALSVSRQAGRRAVFLFYICVVIYLGLTWSADWYLRPVAAGFTTWATPLNPFLAQEVLINYTTYRAHETTALVGANWLTRQWLGNPVMSYCALSLLVSVVLIAWSTLALRVIGQRAGQAPRYLRFLQRMTAFKMDGRRGRTVWKNPIAWREATGKRNKMSRLLARYGFVGIGLLVAIVALGVFHTGRMSAASFQQTLLTILATEVAIIALTALNISATAISREREDGTLDLLLTTPLTASYYLSGKLRGIISFLLPMLAVPIITVALVAAYILAGGLGTTNPINVTAMANTKLVTLPLLLPEGAIILPAVLVPFIAFCVMVGLQWSLKSKGTIGSVLAAVSVVVAAVGVLTLCGQVAGQGIKILGAVMVPLSPTTAVWAIIYPQQVMPDSIDGQNPWGGRIALMIGSVVAAMAYTLVVYGIHKAVLGPGGRNFDMTVRRLAGTH